jgi:serine/threonine-protein kinase
MQRLRRVRETRFGPYVVETPLASGGMGGVYLASHVSTGEKVALKVLDPLFADHAEVVARLYGERSVSLNASHPGLVEILEATRNSEDVPYLVMEYLDGETLTSLCGRGEIAVHMVLRIGVQVANALAALHAAGFVHCDIKPDNLVLMSDHAHVKVIDFGVSRRVDEPPAEDASIAGTPAYMAPEQWRGRAQPASDVYALGCVLFELLTGETPFDGSLPQLMCAHLEQRPPRLSWLRGGISIELERVILRALAKDTALRPTMLELSAELAGLLGERNAGDTMRMAG